jgi:hypothetical protein
MKTFSEQELKDILDKHVKWLSNQDGGYCANLSRANLSGAYLYGADLSHANLSGADLYGADLYGADLSHANLSGADLSHANLSRADLSGADLSGAYLYGANLRETLYEDNTIVSFMYQRHTATYLGTDEIRIGCHIHPIKHWADNFEEIGRKANYSDEQIKRYGNFIKSCAEDFARSKK